MLPRDLRLRRPEDFRQVRRKGKSWSTDHLILSQLPNEREYNRYGFVVSKRLGNAVARNRVKRRLREVVRKRLAGHQQGFDIVIIARQPATSADFWMMNQELAQLEQDAGLAT